MARGRNDGIKNFQHGRQRTKADNFRGNVSRRLWPVKLCSPPVVFLRGKPEKYWMDNLTSKKSRHKLKTKILYFSYIPQRTLTNLKTVFQSFSNCKSLMYDLFHSVQLVGFYSIQKHSYILPTQQNFNSILFRVSLKPLVFLFTYIQPQNFPSRSCHFSAVFYLLA